MPIVKSHFQSLIEQSDITLALYANVVGQLPENTFWGVRRSDDPDYDCNTYWSKWQRDSVLRALSDAQIEYEQETNFPILRRWIADEQQPYSWPLQAHWNMIFDVGIRATEAIATDAVVTHVADNAQGDPSPSTVTVATTVTDVNEIRVYYPASLGVEGPVEIDPSDIDISGGNAVISIPRWRMVHPNFINTPSDGLDYATVTNFLSVVDITRVYHNSSTQGTLVWPHRNNATCTSNPITCCVTCDEYTRTACIYVRDGRVGQLDVLPATYSAGSWNTNTACLCVTPEHAILNYRAGPATMDWQTQLAVIRLAHTKMPDEPCGCEQAQRMWKEDRMIPDSLTLNQANCRFGRMNGAWFAWQQAQATKIWRGATL